MNDHWKSFLQTQSARIGEDGGVRFGHSGEKPACALVDLSHLGLIDVSGEDAETFLQGQSTNDISQITSGRFQIGACCTPKGRMLANFLAFRHREKILLQLPVETQRILLRRLPMFILRSRVKVTDVSASLVRFALLGECTEELLRSRFEALPAMPWDSVQEKGCTLLRHPGETSRIEILGEPDAMTTLWEELARTAAPVDSDRWALENIRAGIPTVHGSTSEAFLPQMTNMQLIGGVSFTKGCYTGQEVVARTRYLGKIKRRMYRARIEGETCPLPGEELFSPGSKSGQGAGRVVDAQASPDGGCEILAVVEIERHDQGDVHIGSVNGEKLNFQALPYSFEKD